MKSLGVRFRVRVGWGIVVLAAVPALSVADEAKGAAGPAPDPFYRKYLVAGNPLDDEILSMEQKVASNPNDAALRTDFGNLLALRKFPEQAAEQYEMAAELDKTNFIAYYNLGILRETEGKTGDAITAYKKSIDRKPGFPQSRFRLGRLYEQEGGLDAAVEQYAKALRIDPSMRDARRNPLVVDSTLMYRASLANYERDVARVTLARDVSFVEEPAFRRAPVDQMLSSDEVAVDEPEEAPREVGPASAGGSSGSAKRPPRTSAAPAGTEPPMRPRPGSRPAPRTVRPGKPATPAGAGASAPAAPVETAPASPGEPPADANPSPDASETLPEPPPTETPETPETPEELEPS